MTSASRLWHSASSQLVHGDLTGNVLFHPELPPLVIDVSPYWRPPAFASAVVVADALVWEGADETLVRDLRWGADDAQFLLRALLFRVVTDLLHRPQEPAATHPYRSSLDLAVRLAAT